VAEDRGVQLHCAPRATVTVRGDGGRLKQVIVNLLDNAIKFTPRGGTVTLSTQALERCGLLEIRDSGIGIRRQHCRMSSIASIVPMKRVHAWMAAPVSVCRSCARSAAPMAPRSSSTASSAAAPGFGYASR